MSLPFVYDFGILKEYFSEEDMVAIAGLGFRWEYILAYLIARSIWDLTADIQYWIKQTQKEEDWLYKMRGWTDSKLAEMGMSESDIAEFRAIQREYFSEEYDFLTSGDLQPPPTPPPK